MKKHVITITVTAPNRITASDVQGHIERMIWIGKEDAEKTVKSGEGYLTEARDAMSLHLKFGEPT